MHQPHCWFRPNHVIGSRLDAHTKGNAAYQDSAADQSNLLMQSYLNG
jgi:hypothetical protein